MKLYIVRHGEAVSEHVNPQRPLSPAGREEVVQVAQFLKKANAHVDQIYHSPLKRAEETAQIIKEISHPSAKLMVKAVSPNDNINPIIEELAKRKEDLMIVSHLPFLPKLISHLVVKDENLNVIGLGTSCVVAMYRDNNQLWQIVWLVSPELIKLT